MARRAAHGIFCLEGDWWGDLNRSSTVKPVLKLLGQSPRYPVSFIHRDVGTREELDHYLRKWCQRGRASYPILYLAFHGAPDCIIIGDRRNSQSFVTFDDLAESLGTGLNGRAVHFGSCETLATDRRNVNRFLRKTGLVAATGFTKQVEWLKSAAFEVLMFEALSRRALTPAGIEKFEEILHGEARALWRRHGFRVIPRR